MQANGKNGLEFSIDSTGGVPLYKQIILQIEMAIADGRISTGEQLPTVRGLAVDLQVNPNTVAKAYNELEIRGIVTTQQGTGTFISDREITLSEVERERVLAQLMRSFIAKAASYGFTLTDLIDSLREAAGPGAGDEEDAASVSSTAYRGPEAKSTDEGRAP